MMIDSQNHCLSTSTGFITIVKNDHDWIRHCLPLSSTTIFHNAQRLMILLIS